MGVRDINLTDSNLIYIVVCSYKDDFFIKIGRTKNLYQRIKNIQTGSPHQITNIFVVFSEFGEEIYGLESVFHKLIDQYKMKGEWYLGSEDFFMLFDSILIRVNSGSLGELVFENEDNFSYDEVEILFHTHNYSFSEIEMPIESNDLLLSTQLLKPNDICRRIQEQKGISKLN
ncbi:GIY-YIG nuclease family protein [Paenibacillus sp. NPDC056579]|uniref:GIY-YIG nuclease family protein n=1 Tax=Paenibacillus sp. NPDC056579 TaxID=3345871 RepID=UPI003689C73D